MGASLTAEHVAGAFGRTTVRHGGPPDSDEAVVFVHGNPGASRGWADLAGRASELGRVLAPDMPGFAGAARPSGTRHTPGGQSEFLGGLLDQLGVRRAHLVLHDLAGLWGLRWAAGEPARFASVALFNTGVLIGYRWHRAARMWRTPVLGEALMAAASVAAVERVLRRQNPRLPPRQARMLAEDARMASRRALLELYRSTDADTSALAPALRPLDRPALVVFGDRDPYLPVWQAELQRAAFPSARVEIMSGHGHWAYLEAPERAAELVLAFLREQLTKAPARA